MSKYIFTNVARSLSSPCVDSVNRTVNDFQSLPGNVQSNFQTPK